MANTENRDFISLLPNDILFIILSKLNTKDQARTSILSRRWTNLWTFSKCLSINAEDFIQRRENSPIKTLKFKNTTDRILTMHTGQFLDQIKITYPDEHCMIPSEVDNWIMIAKQKQVKVLHLDFKFRPSYLDTNNVQRFSLGSTTFSSLATLHLEKAFLSDRAIYDLLFCSPNLLELSIVRSYGLLHPNISGSSLKLKRLEMHCNNFLFLDIGAPNLVSFSFSTSSDTPMWPDRIRFNNTPLLTRLSCPLGLILRYWRNLYPLLPQLVSLTLTLSKKTVVRIKSTPRKFPKLVYLKQMQVRLLSNEDSDRLLGLLPDLLRASPLLHNLSLDLAPLKDNNFIKIDKFSDHASLKVVEINNFKGFLYEVDLLACIAKSCSSFQKIIIHSDLYKTKVKQKKVESIVKKLVAQKKLKIVFKAHNANDF